MLLVSEYVANYDGRLRRIPTLDARGSPCSRVWRIQLQHSFAFLAHLTVQPHCITHTRGCFRDNLTPKIISQNMSFMCMRLYFRCRGVPWLHQKYNWLSDKPLSVYTYIYICLLQTNTIILI